MADNGVISLGFSTTVQPAVSAGASFAAIWCSGKFHGVMAPTTPIGSRSTSEFPIVSSQRISSTNCAIDAKVAVGRPIWTAWEKPMATPTPNTLSREN
jgi:hypothetical protein